MNKILFGSLALTLVIGQAPVAHAAETGAGCAQQLQSVMAVWQAASFTAPAKPAQAHVIGQHGYETTGSSYQRMVGDLRQAASACQAGNEKQALERIDAVQSLLGASHS